MIESKSNKIKKKTQATFSLGYPTISPNKIEKDERIYPRERISQKTIDSYHEALLSGAKFPPILLQKIYDENVSEKIISIDGFHRTEAYKKADMEIPYEWYKDEILDINEHLKELRVVSISKNLTHGDRLSGKDKKWVCRKLAEEDLEISITENEFAEIFGVTQRTINNWISDIRARQKGTRDNLIYRLSALGWTQSEIANKVNLDQSVVSRIMQNSNFTKIHNDYKNNKPISEIAEYYGLDIPMAWSILLEGLDDIERFEKFGKEEFGNSQPKITDYWKFSKGDLRLGLDYPGRMWCQDVMNIIYRYSQQGDLILDPMAGGGVTLDTCLIMNRKCRAFDINPIREDIEQGDIRDGFPEDIKNPDLIILDPPYHKKKEGDYDCEIITKDKDTFLSFLECASQNCYDVLKEGGYLALLFSQYIDYDNEINSILGLDYGNIFENHGFRLILEIQTPLTFDSQYNAPQVNRAKKYNPWRILPVSRSWYIFKKLNE